MEGVEGGGWNFIWEIFYSDNKLGLEDMEKSWMFDHFEFRVVSRWVLERWALGSNFIIRLGCRCGDGFF